MTKQLRRTDSLGRVREARDTRRVFMEEGFGKYYLLARTNEMFEELSGYQLEEGEYHIGDDTVAGPVIGFAIAKPAYAAELADSNLDLLNVVDTGKGLRFGELAGSRDDFYPVSIQDVESALGII